MASTEDRQPTVLRYRGTRVPGTTVRCTRSTVQYKSWCSVLTVFLPNRTRSTPRIPHTLIHTRVRLVPTHRPDTNSQAFLSDFVQIFRYTVLRVRSTRNT